MFSITGEIQDEITLTGLIPDIDQTAPSGYSVLFDRDSYNSTQISTVGIDISGAVIGETYHATISSSGGGSPIIVTDANPSESFSIDNIDCSELTDGTLTVTLYMVDFEGNQGANSTDTAIKDTIAPSGYSILFDQDPITNTEVSNVSFSVSGGVANNTYNYIISSSGGGTPVTGSGTAPSATFSISGVNLSALSSGVLTVQFRMTDIYGNVGSYVTDTSNLTLYDADALAFFNASGITDATQKTAVNTLVLGLKSASLWTGMKAIYPFVGGSASTHKWNLKDPRDLDAAFRLTFSGGITHSSNGITPNGVNGYCETYLSGSDLINNNTSWSIYSRTDATDDNLDIGGANGAGSGLYCFTKRTFGNGGMISFQYETPRIEYPSMPSSTGHIGASRTSSTSHKAYRNGSLLATQTTANGFDITTMATKITLSAYRASLGATPILYSTRNLAFAHIGIGLSDAEFSTLNTLVLAFQTALSRNV